MNINLHKSSRQILFLICSLLGASIFLLIYGPNIINVSNDSWLLSGGDISQHYLGWRFYRLSGWNFPIGLIDGLCYPNKVSIIYTDSIPIFAIIFKLLSPFLPNTFQYFGLWGLLCFILQGGFSALILLKISENKSLCIIFSCFFILSTTMINRMYMHTSLAAHWVILAGICVWLYNDIFNTFHRKVIIWSTILALCPFIHIYFTPMIFIIMCGDLLLYSLEHKKIKESICIILLSLTTLFVGMFLLGAFYGNGSAGSEGLGYYSANINSLINPLGTSHYLRDLPMATGGQYEGYAYLGLGVIILLFICIHIYTENINLSRNNLPLAIRQIIKSNYKRYLPVILVCLAFYMLALSPVITYNTHVLFEIHYPTFINKVLSIFRTSGRFLWAIAYLIMILIFFTINKFSKKSSAIFICSICLIIQVSDLSDTLQQKHKYFTYEILEHEINNSTTWNYLMSNHSYVIFVFESVYTKENSNKVFYISNIAADYNNNLNNFYISRPDSDAIAENLNSIITDLQQGQGKQENIYIFEDFFDIWKKGYSLNYYQLDDCIIGIPEEIPMNKLEGAKRLNADENKIDITPLNNEYLTNGTDTENTRILYPNGISYGPYISLDSGAYRIKVQGLNLQKCDFDIYSNTNDEYIYFDIVDHSDNEVYVQIDLDSRIDNLEFRIHNNTENDITINQMQLYVISEDFDD